MKRIIGMLLAIASVMALVGALAATAAQAEENKGPLWIVGNPAKPLLAGETRSITSRSETPFILHGTVASVECLKVTDSGVLLGGSPGTDYTKIKFEECSFKGKPACKVTGLKPLPAANVGEVVVDALTDLLYAKGSRESALDAFASEGEEGNPNLFTEFQFEKNVTNCGVFSGVAVKVVATGTEVTIKNEKRKLGQLGQIGRTEGGFVLAKPGETSEIGLLRFPENAPVKEGELYNSTTEKYEVVKAALEAKGLGEAFEEGVTIIETNLKELFGWDA